MTNMIEDIMAVCLFLLMLVFGISIVMVKTYLGKKGAIPVWKLITGFLAPWEELGAYINTTRMEYGHIGIWFKLMVASFVAMIPTGIVLAIL
jgi:hypothetical protein